MTTKPPSGSGNLPEGSGSRPPGSGNLPRGSGNLPSGSGHLTSSGELGRARRGTSNLRPPTTIAENLRRAVLALEGAQVEEASLIAEVLLAHVSGLTRTQILARPGQNMPSDALAHFDRLVERMTLGEPLAYVIGHREFCALDFITDARALIPRPETELLVDLALKGLPLQARVADMGTGTGCIAIALAVRAPTIQVVAVDSQVGALMLAEQNAQRHKVRERLTFIRSDLFIAASPAEAAHLQPFNLICANLPYIPTAELDTLQVARAEPRVALDGGADGLTLIRRLLQDAPRLVAPGGRVLLEIGASQGRAVFALAGAFFPQARVKLHKDLAGLDRIVEIQT